MILSKFKKNCHSERNLPIFGVNLIQKSQCFNIFILLRDFSLVWTTELQSLRGVYYHIILKQINPTKLKNADFNKCGMKEEGIFFLNYGS